MKIRHPIRSTLIALLAAVFAMGSAGVPAMSPSEHDTLSPGRLAELRDEDRASAADNRDSGPTQWKQIDGKVGSIDIPRRIDIPDRLE